MVHPFYVLEGLPEDCILGMDFLGIHDIWIRPTAHSVAIGDTGKTIPFLEDTSLFHLTCALKTDLPPRSEVYVKVESNARSGSIYMSEAAEEMDRHGIIIPRGIHEGRPDHILVINSRNERLKLKKGTPIAKAEPVKLCDKGQDKPNEACNFVIGEQLSQAQKDQLLGLLATYEDSFFASKKRPIGRVWSGKHVIETLPGKGPMSQRLRPMAPAERTVVRDEVQKMIDQSVIRPSSSPWASPIVLVKKKDGSTRFCVDYRKLNDITVKDVFPLPRTTDLLESFQGSKYFSTLDAAAGYWQIPMDENSIQKSAFISSEGLFEFLVMPFGLCNAPATFQRTMNCLLAGINGISCLVYLDDIIIFSRSFEEHLKSLEEVFRRLVEGGLVLKVTKCQFAVEQVEYLGHIVSANGLKPDPRKVEKLRSFPQPKNLTELRAFLGFAGYYRRFIKNFALIAAPLFLLLKDDQPFEWKEEQEVAFKSLIQTIESDAILSHPRFDKPFIIDADASGTGLGGVLSQEHEGIERPVAFISRHLSSAEQKWHIRDKEALAIIWALESFRHFIVGSEFFVRTDHASLKWLLDAKTGRHGRWAVRLMEFGPFQIKHRSGKEHTNVDALSRIPTASDAMPDKATCFALTEVQRLPSKEEFQGAQGRDEACVKALRQVLTGQTEVYKIVDGVLAITTKVGPRVLLPEELVDQVIKIYHENPLQGHLGITKTARKIGERFHLPRLKARVAEVLMRCLPCQQRKHRQEHHIDLASRPSSRAWSTVAADFCGPYNTGASYRYILVIVDHFTKWVELIPTKTQEAKEVAQAFYDRIICRHGCPKRFLTDQGSCFKSNLVEHLCSLFQIQKIYSSAYFPQGDGTAERFMRSLNDALSILSRHHPEDWPSFVQGVAFAYNSSVHASTGQTPFMLNTGRVPSFPEEGWIRYWNEEHEKTNMSKSDYSKYLKELTETISHAQGHARQGLEAAWVRMSRQYRPDTKKIQVGDKVLVRLNDWERSQFPIRKLAPHWSPPATVEQVLSNGKTFKILREGKSYTVNRERLLRLPPQTRLEGFQAQAARIPEEEVGETDDTKDEEEEDYWTARWSQEGPRLNVTGRPVHSSINVSKSSSPASLFTRPSVEVEVTESSSEGPESTGCPVFLGSSTLDSLGRRTAGSSFPTPSSGSITELGTNITKSYR